MGLCCCCRWFLFPTKILHVYFITLFTALNEYTLLMLCFAIMHTGPKWLAITGFGVFGAMSVYSLRGVFAFLTEDAEFKGELLFRLYAAEVCAGPVSAIVLCIPALWKPFLGRVLDHRLRDGGRFEKKEVAQFLLLNVFPAFAILWVITMVHYNMFTLVSMFLAGGTAALTSFPRIVRWCSAFIWYIQHCIPCCYRLFGKCSYLQVESPYGEGMWGAVAKSDNNNANLATVNVLDALNGGNGDGNGDSKPAGDKKAKDGDKDPTAAVVLVPTFPLTRIITFELTTDADKKQEIDDMKSLGKPKSTAKFPTFANVAVFEQMERHRLGEFTLDMYSPKDSEHGLKRGQSSTKLVSPSGATLLYDSPMNRTKSSAQMTAGGSPTTQALMGDGVSAGDRSPLKSKSKSAYSMKSTLSNTRVHPDPHDTKITWS